MAAERRLNQPTISDLAEGSALPEIRLHSNSYTSEGAFAPRRQAHIIVIGLSSDEAIVLVRPGGLLQDQSLAAQYNNVEASPWPQDGGPLIE
jgi:hypothetical protein